MKLKYLNAIIQILRIPGFLPIFRDLKPFVRTHFIYAGLETGLLETLQTPCSRDDLLETLGVERPEILDALLHLGLSLKEIGRRKGLYYIRGKRSRSVICEKSDALAAMIQGLTTYYNNAYRNAADIMRGASLGDDLFKIGAIIGRIGKLDEPLLKTYISSIIAGKKEVRLLDIGCGSGVFLKCALEANPNSTGLGIDIDEEVVNQARENMKQWGIDDKFVILKSDILGQSDEIKETYDVITLCNVLYYFPVEKRIDLFKRLRSFLSEEGVVALVNSMQSENGDLLTANLNLYSSTAKGITVLPDLNETIDQLKEGGFPHIEVTKFVPGGEVYGIVASVDTKA